MLFQEGDVSVDGNFVRIGPRSITVSEIKRLDQTTHREDSHIAPILWLGSAFAAVLGFGAPILWMFTLILGALAYGKQRNPKPPVHWLLISCGGLTNSFIHRSPDAGHIERLRSAIELAMKGGVAKAATFRVPTTKASSSAVKKGPWGELG